MTLLMEAPVLSPPLPVLSPSNAGRYLILRFSLALETYEKQVRQVIRDFFEQIDAAGKTPLNFSLYATLIPLDAIGLVAYSRNLGCVQSGHDQGVVARLESLFKFIAQMGHLYWPVAIWSAWFPSEKHLEFEKMIEEFVAERLKPGNESARDLLSYFIEDFEAEKPKTYFDMTSLHADAQAVFIGGVYVAFLAHPPPLPPELCCTNGGLPIQTYAVLRTDEHLL